MPRADRHCPWEWVAALLLVAACGPASPAPTTVRPTATAGQPTPSVMPAASPTPSSGFTVRVDAQRDVRPISPLVYGLAGTSEVTLTDLQPTLISWGGNASTRYNWEIGNAWNAGSDWFYRNGNYDYTGGSASDDFFAAAAAHRIATRLSVPTLGWVAKDDNNATCSFPLAGGGCGDAGGADCEHPGPIANPRLANVPSDVASITAWINHLQDDEGTELRFIALDNEPELWGYTHYDVHPACTTYTEILDKYLTYAKAIRAVAPAAELVGPNTCCWYYYWNSAAGEADKAAHEGADFLPWFLDQVRQADEQAGVRTLDVLDVHYYPDGLYNDEVDAATAAHRLRSTRSLWDVSYVDESWIAQPVALIPRLQRLIDARYPGTQLGLSEWNWGADETMNGALAIADVLGILGREQVYYAAYGEELPPHGAGFNAFKLYTNYDDQGSRFGDKSVWSQSDDLDQVASHAALDSISGRLYLMLLNKQPEAAQSVTIDLRGFSPQGNFHQFRLTADDPTTILSTVETWDAHQPVLDLPAYSITLLVFEPA